MGEFVTDKLSTSNGKRLFAEMAIAFCSVFREWDRIALPWEEIGKIIDKPDNKPFIVN